MFLIQVLILTGDLKGGGEVKIRRLLCVMMACAVLVSCFSINAGAVGAEYQAAGANTARATGRFSMDVPGGQSQILCKVHLG